METALPVIDTARDLRRKLVEELGCDLVIPMTHQVSTTPFLAPPLPLFLFEVFRPFTSFYLFHIYSPLSPFHLFQVYPPPNPFTCPLPFFLIFSALPVSASV